MVVLFGITHGVVAEFPAVAAVVRLVLLRLADAGEVADDEVPAAVPGALFAALAVEVALPGVLIAGHGAEVFVVVVEDVPVMPLAPLFGTDDVAPAGTLLLGFVVEVAEPGVVPVVFVVPFCCVADVALPGVVFGVGVMPGLGWIPGVGWIPGDG